jgi:cullin-associated NEDD8-dissociated protein 1
LNTLREIIQHNPKCLKAFINKLLPLLIEQSKNEDEQIRGIVSENLGRLYIFYSREIHGQFEKSFKSQSDFERATVVKSFKFGASKDSDVLDIEQAVEPLAHLVRDADINVRRFALESLTAITHTLPHAVRDHSQMIQEAANAKTKIDPSLIKEVDLGPFKHKVDDGIVIRKAAYALLDTLVERIPERVNTGQATEIAIYGLEDTAEECMI